MVTPSVNYQYDVPNTQKIRNVQRKQLIKAFISLVMFKRIRVQIILRVCNVLSTTKQNGKNKSKILRNSKVRMKVEASKVPLMKPQAAVKNSLSGKKRRKK